MLLRSALFVPALCLVLTGCGKAPEQPAGKAAGAEVLPGTISDAMLNLDRSQARPLLQPPPAAGAPAEDAASEAPSDGAPDSEVAQPVN